ncbi:MAG: hypothetical protein NZM44_07145 [Candidatus Calescibacterium sp.]|nr:hypothetical protein [Candidatus Calescibacterium sp.]
MPRRLSCKVLKEELLGSDGKILKEIMYKITIPEFNIFNSKFAGKPEDKFKTMFCISEVEDRKVECGLMTK